MQTNGTLTLKYANNSDEMISLLQKRWTKNKSFMFLLSLNETKLMAPILYSLQRKESNFKNLFCNFSIMVIFQFVLGNQLEYSRIGGRKNKQYRYIKGVMTVKS